MYVARLVLFMCATLMVIFFKTVIENCPLPESLASLLRLMLIGCWPFPPKGTECLIVMKSRGGSGRDALCCCEYISKDEERSHILESCCNCEALDTVCDRLLTCRRLQPGKVEEMFETIEDRCRIPSCTGGGATKIKLDVAIPVLLIPTCLLLGTVSSAMTTIMLLILPLSLYLFYRLWMRRPQKNRTQLFYIWGLVSVFQMYLTFETIVVAFRKILLWENLLLSTIFGLMLFALFHAKKNPGVLQRKSHSIDKDEQEYKWKQQQLQQQLKISEMEPSRKNPGQCQEDCTCDHQEIPEAYEHLKKVVDSDDFKPEYGLLGNVLMQNFGFGAEGFEQNLQEEKEKTAGQVIPQEEVTWVDSRMIKEGFLVTWCPDCKLHKTPRSGHCPVCNVCIESRDHHCVWIDSCIGARNHRSFFLAVLLFIIGSCYGIHLTLTTVCTPEMYWDWFLLPSNCQFVYADFPTAISWVSACYSIIATAGMSMVLLQQCLFISQDLTSQELHTSWRRGWGYWCCFTKNNRNNRGCLRNWWGFLGGRRMRNQIYPSVSV